MIGLCLAALMGAATGRIDLPDGHFSLRWVHSIEKIQWREEWQVTPAGLVGGEVRIKGSGAGMEPPDDAVHRDGWYIWTMKNPPLPSLILARSNAVPDHRLCLGESCRPLSALVGGSGPVRIEPCHDP